MSLNSFLKIDRRNSISLYDEDSIISLKISLYGTLAQIGEESITTELIKFINKNYETDKDLLKNNINFAKKHLKEKFNNTNDSISDEVKNLIESILEKSNDLEFNFYGNTIEELSKILIYSFSELEAYTSYGMKGENDFYNKINNIQENNIDIMKIYLNRMNNDKKSDLVSGSTRNSFTSDNSNNRKSYCLELPDEIVVLLNKYQTIKKVNLILPFQIQDLSNFYFLLFNMEWLFPHLIETDLDLECSSLNTYLKEQSKQNKFDYETHKQYYLKLILYFSYFISMNKKIKILTLNIPYSFQADLEDYLTKKNIVYNSNNNNNITSFHFLIFLKEITDLIQLNIHFNSLEFETFEKLLYIINNNDLKILRLNLFSEEEFYSNSFLVKLCESKKINIKQIMSDKFKINRIDDIVSKLLDYFENNLSNLFFIIHTKNNLYEFNLTTDIPNILINNDKFITLFQKFLFNIIGLIYNNPENKIKMLNLTIPFFPFDNKKYPTISKFLNSISSLNKKINNLTIEMKLNSIPNLCNIISNKILYLSLGYLDKDTLFPLLNYLKSKEFVQNSHLISLKLKLSQIIFKLEDIEEQLLSFLKSKKPKNLREIYLITNLEISNNKIQKIMNMIDYDTLERYEFEFNKKSEIFKIDNLNIYCTIERVSLYKFLPVILKKYKMAKANVYKNIKKYFDSYQKKDIIIHYK
jgi:hypothetical protein